MIGIRVETEDGEAFGTLKDVIETGANDVYVVETSSHGEVLILQLKNVSLKWILKREGWSSICWTGFCRSVQNEFLYYALFPEMVMDGLHTSIIGRAVNKRPFKYLRL